MDVNIHLEAGSPLSLETYDLWEDKDILNERTQIIKLRGTDCNGGSFSITLFGNNALQSIVSINNLDDTEFRINGFEIDNEMLNPVTEEDSNG